MKLFLFSLYEKYYTQNFYFPVQFLFAWVGFKLLGFLKVIFWVRVVFAIFFLYIFFHYWQFWVPKFLSNFVFQFYLYCFYLLINLILSLNGPARFLGVFLGIFSLLSSFYPVFVETEMRVFFLPNLDYLLFVLLLFNFFKRFNDSIVIAVIENGFGYGKTFQFQTNDFFYWVYLIEVLSCYFEYKYIIKKNVFFYNIYPFKYFPFSSEFMRLLCDSGTLDNTLVSAKFTERLKKAKDINEKEKIIEESVKEVHDLVAKRIEIGAEAALLARLPNSSFYRHIVQGLIIGAFLFFYLLNF